MLLFLLYRKGEKQVQWYKKRGKRYKKRRKREEMRQERYESRTICGQRYFW